MSGGRRTRQKTSRHERNARQKVGRDNRALPQSGEAGHRESGPRATVAVARRFAPGTCDVIAIDTEAPRDLRAEGTVLWIDVQGTADSRFVRALGELYGLHPLAVEDSLNLHQRAKVETYPSHGFLVARMVHFERHVELEQIAMFIGSDFVITVQGGILDGDPFDQLRSQLAHGAHHPPIASADTLAHALLDAVVDGYFPVLDLFGESLEALEDRVIAGREDVVADIQLARRDVVAIRRALWPLRDALYSLGREGLVLGSEMRLYMRDIIDHLLRVIELAEAYRETVSSLMELHLSTLSQKMNETMRFLAVISTIFIPLTFIAGVYGMNFDPGVSDLNMPELRSPFGYPVVLGIMLLIGVGLVLFFRQRGWLGGRSPGSGGVDHDKVKSETTGPPSGSP